MKKMGLFLWRGDGTGTLGTQGNSFAFASGATAKPYHQPLAFRVALRECFPGHTARSPLPPATFPHVDLGLGAGRGGEKAQASSATAEPSGRPRRWAELSWPRGRCSTCRTSPAVTLPALDYLCRAWPARCAGSTRSSMHRSPWLERRRASPLYFRENSPIRLHVLLAFPPKYLLCLSSFHLHVLLLRVEC